MARTCLNLDINHFPNRWNSKYKYKIIIIGAQEETVNRSLTICFTHTSVFSPKKDFASAGTSVIFPLDFECIPKQVVRTRGQLPVEEESK